MLREHDRSARLVLDFFEDVIDRHAANIAGLAQLPRLRGEAFENESRDAFHRQLMHHGKTQAGVGRIGEAESRAHVHGEDAGRLALE